MRPSLLTRRRMRVEPSREPGSAFYDGLPGRRSEVRARYGHQARRSCASSGKVTLFYVDVLRRRRLYSQSAAQAPPVELKRAPPRRTSRSAQGGSASARTLRRPAPVRSPTDRRGGLARVRSIRARGARRPRSGAGPSSGTPGSPSALRPRRLGEGAERREVRTRRRSRRPRGHAPVGRARVCRRRASPLGGLGHVGGTRVLLAGSSRR